MRPFILRYEERPKYLGSETLVLGAPSSSPTTEPLAAQTGTKTLTEVKRESGDKDRAASSCRAFQTEEA
jgi:hypothetical protein